MIIGVSSVNGSIRRITLPKPSASIVNRPPSGGIPATSNFPSGPEPALTCRPPSEAQSNAWPIGCRVPAATTCPSSFSAPCKTASTKSSSDSSAKSNSRVSTAKPSFFTVTTNVPRAASGRAISKSPSESDFVRTNGLIGRASSVFRCAVISASLIPLPNELSTCPAKSRSSGVSTSAASSAS